jgi:arginyl-tRNA synthetase
MNLLQLLQQTFHEALAGLVADPAPYVLLVKPSQDPRYGDYQANCAMPLAKVLGKKPREVAELIVGRLNLGSFLEPPEITGPGFINLRLKTEWLAQQVQRLGKDDRLSVEPASPARTLVIDYSSPNVAKPMHVGHLRSTIIGDALARLFRFLGHKVVTDNHLGDWGTQFGMLLYGYKNFRDEEAFRESPVRELSRLYIEVRKLAETFRLIELGFRKFLDRAAFQADPVRELARVYVRALRGKQSSPEEDEESDCNNPIANAYRNETAKLHAGDPENVALWREFLPACLEEIDAIYRRLDVGFDNTLGESFYNSMLPQVVSSLRTRGIAQESDGAVVVFLDQSRPPALIQKKDGAFTYTTSDLATIRYRVEQWQPDSILYVVDARQTLHFKNLFEAARRWGYDRVNLEHVSFGSVLGQDRKPIKTREGGAVELSSLLDEAVERATQAYLQNRLDRLQRGEEVPELSPQELKQIYDVVGIGAVKYADLSQNRTTDYVFSWDKMLAMDGNTATYMQYAYARVRSIFRKGAEDEQATRQHPPQPYLQKPEERALALQLLRLGEALENAAAEYKPNVITAYLWDLAKTYSGFYQNCPVLKADTPVLRQGRLFLCDLTARAIQLGLSLLGIQTVERM